MVTMKSPTPMKKRLSAALKFCALKVRRALRFFSDVSGLGYTRAARMIDILEARGMVSPGDGAKPREVLIPGYHDEA